MYAPKFPPITLVKAFLKFECNIYLDMDFKSAISVSSTASSRSFTELMDRLAFVNFSSPALNIHVSGTHAKQLTLVILAQNGLTR